MKIFKETQRLRIRRFDENDFENMLELDSDPDVMKYISGGKTTPPEEMKNILARTLIRYDEWKVYGVWAVELKDSGEFMGWVSLKPLPGTEEIEVGYRFRKKFWGKGFATEAATAMMSYGFNELKMSKIVAITDPENRASKNVLQKVGLKYVDDRTYVSSPTAQPRTVSWFEAYQ
jgi:RimJ/RimL family protein N-acetyltransferase